MFYILLPVLGIAVNVLALIVNGIQGNEGWMVINAACVVVCAGCLKWEMDRR